MEAITFNDLIKVAVVIMGMWAFYKVVTEIIKAITARHDREQKWDDTANDLRKERQEDVCQYNKQLTEIRNQQDEIRTDFEGKVQEIKAEQYIIVECLRAVLDGLHQQGCNGKVSDAINTLDDYLLERAHK
jgi:F0F1-type ATP synthase membrane subunit b/b'